MSVYIDNFIKNHKEYFSRNRQAIEANNWNDDSSYQESLNRLTKELKEASTDKKENSIRNEIIDLGNNQSKRKTELFKQEKQLVSSIVSRLSVFIKETESKDERHYKKVQDFVDFTVDIIYYHLDKCDSFLDYSTNKITEEVDTQEELEYKSSEILFQDDVFKSKISIMDTLSGLRISDATESIDIKFFKDEKASLILKEPLTNKIPDVQLKVENLSIEWGLLTSKEMLINMKPKDIPKWNPKKQFWQQDLSTLQFWTEEFNKIKHGITINGFYIHPWLYFHLNFFKTPIPQQDGTEPIVNPPLRDNEWFFAETLKEAQSEDYPGYYKKVITLFGSRRISKSTIMASVAHWRILTKANAKGTILGGNSGDIIDLTDKVKKSLDHINHAFSLKTIKQDWENGLTTFGIKTDNSTSVLYSSLKVMNLDGGQTRKTQLTAGGDPSVFIVDEIAKFSFMGAYTAALPSFKTRWGMKAPVILSGTSGEETLAGDALKLVSNPEAYDVMTMNWDKLEHGIDPDQITWKRRNFATFIPGQMGYETDVIKNPMKFSDFIGNQAKQLDNIEIQVTDWENNKKVLEGLLEKARNDKSGNATFLEQQEKVFHPMDPEDCFLSAKSSPLPGAEAKKHRDKLIEKGDIGKKVWLEEKANGDIDYEMTNQPLADYPFGGGFFDAPGVLYEDLPEYTPPDYLYVAGFDDYKQEESDTDSIGSFHIYKVAAGLDEYCGTPVYSIATRPDPWVKMYEQIFLAMKAFNAKCFMENADLGFKQYLERKRMAEMWLVESMDLKSDMIERRTNGKKKYGWSPTAENKKNLFGLFVNYCHQEIEVENSDGEIEIRKGVERIKDIGLLDEIAKYKEGNNVDRITSFMSCLGYELYLINNWLVPTADNIRRKREAKENRDNINNYRNLAQRMYGIKKRQKFF